MNKLNLEKLRKDCPIGELFRKEALDLNYLSTYRENYFLCES